VALDNNNNNNNFDIKVIFLYYRHYVKDVETACDTDCLRSRLCYTATSQMGDLTQCEQLLCEFDGTCSSDKNH
jgi:hypothetical protein